MKNKLIKNKQGEIPVTILVLGVIALCALALLSFLVANGKTSAELKGISAVEKMNCEIEKFEFYKNKFDIEKAEEFIGAKDVGLGKQIFVKEGNIEVSFNLN